MTVSRGVGLRVLIVVLGALLAAQLLLIAVTSLKRARDFEEPVAPALVSQVGAAVDLLDRLPPEARENAVRALDSPFVHMRLLDAYPDTSEIGRPISVFRPVISAYEAALPDREFAVYRQRFGRLGARRLRPWGGRLRATEILVVVKLEDGSALAVEPSRVYRQHMAIGGLALASSILGGVILAALVWASLATTRPLRDMARAADRFASDLDAPPMAEAGPEPVRDLARAFNRMQGRLRGLVDERMTTLAAVSHDLRTYLTRLRMRAEFIADDAQREKTVADLDGMTELVEDTLTLARAIKESPRDAGEAVDVAALVRELSEERAERGEPVFLDLCRFSAPLMARGGRTSVARAVSNVIDNAVRYGRAAHVSVTQTDDRAVVVVRDEGPGVPDAALGSLGAPFYRLDASRSRDTGGTGLGLAIAKAVAERAGGGLELRNIPGGFEVRLAFARVAPTPA